MYNAVKKQLQMIRQKFWFTSGAIVNSISLTLSLFLSHDAENMHRLTEGAITLLIEVKKYTTYRVTKKKRAPCI